MHVEQANVPSMPGALRADEHTVPLAGTGWRLWRTACLRGAGFPAQLVNLLAAPDTARAADAYVAARRSREEAYEGALDRLRRADATDPETRRRLRAARRRLRSQTVPVGSLGEDGESELTAAIAAEEAARRRLADAYAAEGEAVRSRLAEAAQDSSLREAARWQTGRALAYAAAALRGPAGQKQRQATEFIALLIQRYAVKNDTCGFFGPAGWLEVVDEPGCVWMEPSRELTSRREVYFEGWTVDAVTDLFDRTPGLRRWALPRPLTEVWRGPEGDPYAPGRGRIVLSPEQRLVWAACDGATTAHAIAGRLTEAGTAGRTESDVYATLQSLVDLQVLAWKFEVRPQLHPEQDLAARIALIGDDEERARCGAILDNLVAARERVSRAMGDPERLGEALEAFDAQFEELTGAAAQRNHGLMYAARSLLYHDSRRAGSVRLGTGFVAKLGPPLGVMLDGARWLLTEVAATMRAHLRACLADLRAASGSDVVDAHLFVQHAKSDQWMRNAVPAHLLALEQKLHDAWSQVLTEPVHESEHRVLFDVASAAERAERVFSTTGECWNHVRQLSPDVMVSAKSAEALDRGEFECVLGELHCGNTITISALAAQHPEPDRLAAALAAESNGQQMVLRQWPKRGWLARANQHVVVPGFWRYGLGEDLESAPGCRLIPAAGLVAVDDGTRVVLRARDGSVEFDALELFHDWLVPEVNDLVAHVHRRPGHTPRITLGALTIARERWDLPAADLAFAHEKDEAERFAAARSWARSHGMPLRLFYKTPIEPKPCYLDLDSPTYVTVLSRMLRRLAPDAVVAITEMMPAVDEAWLADAQDVRYTSELRFVLSPPPGPAHRRRSRNVA